jgi:hypothetical protein
MLLKNLIKELENQPQENSISFDFCGAAPNGIDSSRGSYDELALSFDFGETKVSNLLKMCKAAIGTTYHGYKGGEYVMNETTPVWVDNYGIWSSTKITGVHDLGYGYSIISTMNDEI